MSARPRLLEIALDLDFAEFLLNGAGFVIEVQALRAAGNLTVVIDPSNETLRRLTAYLDRMDIAYNIAWDDTSSDDSFRRPRHSAP